MNKIIVNQKSIKTKTQFKTNIMNKLNTIFNTRKIFPSFGLNWQMHWKSYRRGVWEGRATHNKRLNQLPVNSCSSKQLLLISKTWSCWQDFNRGIVVIWFVCKMIVWRVGQPLMRFNWLNWLPLKLTYFNWHFSKSSLLHSRPDWLLSKFGSVLLLFVSLIDW